MSDEDRNEATLEKARTVLLAMVRALNLIRLRAMLTLAATGFLGASSDCAMPVRVARDS